MTHGPGYGFRLNSGARLFPLLVAELLGIAQQRMIKALWKNYRCRCHRSCQAAPPGLIASGLQAFGG